MKAKYNVDEAGHVTDFELLRQDGEIETVKIHRVEKLPPKFVRKARHYGRWHDTYELVETQAVGAEFILEFESKNEARLAQASLRRHYTAETVFSSHDGLEVGIKVLAKPKYLHWTIRHKKAGKKQ